MSKERYQRLKELLFEASEREGRARADYLDEQCRDDADLRAEIDRLLSDSEPPTTKVGGHIARRALPETGPGLREAPDLQGLWFGRYQLVELLGEGGMGSVWLAQQQEPVRRQVALKVIRLGLDSQCVVTRFEAERQALALMDHHAIARVFDGGVGPGGRPYFVMEHVPGTAITRYCDEQSLTLEQRIELFIEVCDAIHHAHQKGVIHRDLKPSNILVARGTDGPIVKVIDFGIAKAINRKLTDETLVTEVSQILGTPEYMAPEQTDRARNDVDIRADIYSLGVVLYELITGTRPFELASIATLGYEALLDHIRAVDPPLPSARVAALDDASRQRISQARGESTRSFGRQLRGDIDWVVRRSLEKDRDRRYASATALADDLRRYLTHEPVLAKAPSRTYLLRKFYRRHRGGVLAATLALTALVGGAALATWAFIRESDQRMRTAQQAERAERNFNSAQSAVEDLLTGIASIDLVDVPQVEAVRRRLLEKALSYYESFLADRGDDASLRLDTVRALNRVGRVRRELGELETAREAFARALMLITAAEPDLAARESEIEAWIGRAEVGIAQGRLEEADQDQRRAIALIEAGGFQATQSTRRLQAEVLRERAQYLADTSQIEESIAAANEAIEVLSSLPVTEDRDVIREAECRLLIANLHMAQARLEPAANEYRAGIRAAGALLDSGSDSIRLQQVLASLLIEHGRVLQRQRKKPEAHDLYTRGIELRRRSVREYPLSPSFRLALARALHITAHNLWGLQRTSEAEALHEEAISLLKALTEEYPDQAEYADSLADAYLDLGHLHERDAARAQSAYEKALEVSEALVARQEPTAEHFKLHGTVLREIAGTMTQRGHLDEGRRFAESSVAVFEALVNDHPGVALFRQRLGLSHHQLAWTLVKSEDDPRAAVHFERAVQEQERAVAISGNLGTYADYLMGSYRQLVMALSRVEDPKALSNAAERWAKTFEKDQQVQLNAAGCHVYAMKLESGEARERHAARAVETLRRAIELGFDQLDALANDPDFAELHEHTEFLALIGER